jgi:hypothetical protein
LLFLDLSAFFSDFEVVVLSSVAASDLLVAALELSFLLDGLEALEELASVLLELLLFFAAGVALALELEVSLLFFAAGVEAEVALLLEVVADGFAPLAAEAEADAAGDDGGTVLALADAFGLAAVVARGEALGLAVATGDTVAVGATDDEGAADAVGATDAVAAAVGAVEAAEPDCVVTPVRVLLVPTPTEMPTDGCTP